MTQLYPSKVGCNKCGGQISWDVSTRERLGTKLPLNLDGTIHDRESCANNKAVDPQSLLAIPGPTATTTVADARTKAIEQAHEENMRASEELRRSVESLTISLASLTDIFTRVDKSIIFLSETIRAYLQMSEHK